MKKRKYLTTVIIIALLVIFVQGTKYLFYTFGRPVSARIVDGKTKGDPGAPLQIVEYTDFQCPGCATGAKVLKEFLKGYPGDFYVRYHHYPIPGLHPHAIRTAVYAECAAKQNKFWPFHDLLFEERQSCIRCKDIDATLLEMAHRAGLNESALKVCVEDDKIEAIVRNEKEVGRRRGVRATPTFFVNDKMFVGASPLKKEFIKLMEAEIKDKYPLRATKLKENEDEN